MNTAWKYVRLLAPEIAERLGIPAEAPVFVSPYVNDGESCPWCGGASAPLVYQIGQAAVTLHRAPSCPGIYHYHGALARASFIESHFVLRGAADCETAGVPDRVLACESGRRFLAEQLLACCPGCVRVGAAPYAADGGWALCVGAVVLWYGSPGELVPVCARHVAAGPATWRTPWALVLRDGVPSFRYAREAA